MEVISSIYNSGYNIKKFYLGSRELNLAYLGNQVIYDEVIGDNDLNYILYEFYGSDTLPNTVEAPVKSAILKGQTLVNVVSSYGFGGDNKLYESRFYERPFNAGETFTIFVVNPNISAIKIGKHGIDGGWLGEINQDVSINKKLKFTVPENQICKYVGVVVTNENDSIGFENGLVIVAGDQTHLDIDTYFDGMQSVRMPVLTTSNSSLFANFDVNYTDDGKDILSDFIEVNNVDSSIKLYPTFDTTISNTSFQIKIIEYDKDKNVILTKHPWVNDTLAGGYYLNSNTSYIQLGTAFGQMYGIYNKIGLSTVNDMVYIPFKSNILSTSEDVELRGIGSMKDTLDLSTGKLVQRFGEVVLNGNENWVVDSNVFNNTYRFTLTISNMISKDWFNTISQEPFVKSNMFKSLDLGAEEHNLDTEHLTGWDNSRVVLNINKTKLSENSVNALKTYLQQNPITVQYQLATESIKTVDLTIVDQDGKTINKLNSFNGTTHISTEVAENSAYPMVSLEVASELQAAMSKVAEDIELIKPVQNDIETTIDTQSNDIDSLLLATTELFEMFL